MLQLSHAAAVVDIDSSLEWLAKEIGTLLVIGGVLRLFFQPFIDNYLFNSLHRKHVELKSFLAGENSDYPMFGKNLAASRDALDLAKANRDATIALREMIDAQGGAIMKLGSQVDSIGSMREALDRIDRAVEKMADSIAETRDIVQRMQGQWDGIDRRSRHHND